MAVRIADTIKQMNDADFPVAYAGDVAISNTDSTTVEEKLNELGGKTSDNNFTNAYKTSLDNLPTELAKKVDVDGFKQIIKQLLDNIDADLDKKVDKVTGKGLSTNDYTDTDKAEVAKIKDKVGFTDYATDTKTGVVKVGSIKGIKVDESGEIGLNVPNETAIAQRLQANSNLPITIGNLDYAVRSVRPTKSNSLPNTLAVNTIYDLLKEQTVTLNLPSFTKYGDFIQVDIYSGETPTNLTITCPGGSLSDIDLIPEANTMYSLYFDFGTMYVSEKNDSGAIAIDIGWRFSYAAYPHEEV